MEFPRLMSTSTPFWRSPVVYIAAQLAPFAMLAVAYQTATVKLDAVRFDSVTLSHLLMMSAVLTPLLSQLFSGPLFRSLQGTEDRSFAMVTATALRNTPKALAIGALPVVILGAIFSQAFRWGSLPAGVMLGTISIHLLFGVTLVPAYARRRSELLLLGWGGYAVAFSISPQFWWLPSTVGILLELSVLFAIAGRRLREARVTLARDMLAGLVRSFSAAVPLWSIPFGLFLLGRWDIDPERVFAAMIPALLGYQFFFSAVAAPMWRRIDYAHRQLSELPAGQAASAIDGLSRRAKMGEARVVGVLALLVITSLPLITAANTPANLVSLGTLLASCSAVILIAQLCRLGMLGQTAPSYAVGGALLVNMLVCAGFHFDLASFLFLHFGLCAAGTIVVAGANYLEWRRPEYALFWRRALRQ
ncbi:hypothetical protein BH10ACT6_BH10ACT6_01350 [soil metagenome]